MTRDIENLIATLRKDAKTNQDNAGIYAAGGNNQEALKCAACGFVQSQLADRLTEIILKPEEPKDTP